MEHNPMYVFTLRDRAISFCIEHVFGWDTLTEEQREVYIRKTIKLFLESTEIQQEIFGVRLN